MPLKAAVSHSQCSLRRNGLLRWLGLFLGLHTFLQPLGAVTLWNDAGSTLVRDTSAGKDILEGAIKRDDTSSDILYFKFHVTPLSDASTEEYFAALELFEGDTERLAIGNALKAWGYSAFFNPENSSDGRAPGYIDLHSARPEPPAPGAASNYELPRRGVQRTIVFKVQYVPDAEDLVTVWLNPDLGPGANEVLQPETLITRFTANASFDEVRLRHGGGGGGWTFSDLAIATSFADFVDTSSAKPGGTASSATPGDPLPNFQSWQRQEGVPTGPIRALAQTRDGYVWLGGDDGLARFDGVRFVTFDLHKESHGEFIRALCGDSSGALWVGAAGGLARVQNGTTSWLGTQNGLPSDSILSLAEDNEGRVWVGTEAGLAVLQKGQKVSAGGAEMIRGNPITALDKDLSGTMWVAAQGAGVFSFHGGKSQKVEDGSVGALLESAYSLLVDHAGRLWVGAGDDFLLCHDRDQWHRYRLPRHSPKPYVTALAEEPDGTVWAGSISEGLFRFKDGKLSAVNASSGLSDNLVNCFLLDREGKLWVGTDAGLNRLRYRSLFAFGQDEGLGQGVVRGLAEVAPGVVWALKPNGGIYRWEGKTFTRLNAAGLEPRDPALGAVLVARDGSCWMASTNGLLYFKDPQAVADESRLFPLPGSTIISLAEDQQGRIWAGTQKGTVWRLAEGLWLEMTALRQATPVTAVLPEPDGSVWIGTDGEGLTRYKDSKAERHDKRNGLLSDSIRTLYRSGNLLWIGTSGGGLSCWSENRLRTFTTRDGLTENTITQILEDDSGRLWLGGNRGIACVARKELEDLAERKITAVHPRLYDRTEGMLSEECSSGFFPAGLTTRSGLLWFSTTKGIALADSHHQSAPGPAPAVLLEDVLVDGISDRSIKTIAGGGGTAGELPSFQALRIPPGKHRCEIQYTSLSFDAAEQMRFAYRMDGLDTDWVEAGARRTAFYNYIPPGEYRFQVIARDNSGAWSEAAANLELTVSRHFWQRGWVISLGGIGLLFLVGGTVRLVEKRKRVRVEQERALERERTRIARDLHDEMGARLCRISFLSEDARQGGKSPEELQQQIASISDASREVLRSLDEIVWAVNPQNDTLEHVASYVSQYAHDYFQMTGIECELDIPAALPSHPISAQARHHLFLALNEAFTNTLKHSNATCSRVSAACNNVAFEISTSDNGAGFDPSQTESEALKSGNGLRNMRRRLSEIGGHCEVRSSPGIGTTIRFTLPLNGPTRHA